MELRALFTHFDVRNQGSALDEEVEFSSCAAAGCLSAQDLKGVLVRRGTQFWTACTVLLFQNKVDQTTRWFND